MGKRAMRKKAGLGTRVGRGVLRTKEEMQLTESVSPSPHPPSAPAKSVTLDSLVQVSTTLSSIGHWASKEAWKWKCFSFTHVRDHFNVDSASLIIQ